MFLGWFTVPLLKFSTESLAKQVGADAYPTEQSLYDSVPYHIANTLSQIAKLAMLVYGADIIKIFLTCMGFTFPHLQEFPQNFAKILYIMWLVQGICKWKSQWIAKNVTQRDALGRAKVVDRLLDAAIMAVTTMVLFDILSFQLGLAGKSVFAIGSVGTLVVSLASQGFVTHILNGLLLASSDRIYEGDQVKFGNGIEGKIVKLGWMETILRGSDEIIVSVPNADLAGERVSNLSRIHKSQVKQTLRFEYKDADRLPLLVKDIKKEIMAACPELITDESRPFRVHFTGYGPDHLQVRVNAHFDIKPVGDEYWENRQRVLMAIRKAVKQHDMEFAITQG